MDARFVLIVNLIGGPLELLVDGVSSSDSSNSSSDKSDESSSSSLISSLPSSTAMELPPRGIDCNIFHPAAVVIDRLLNDISVVVCKELGDSCNFDDVCDGCKDASTMPSPLSRHIDDIANRYARDTTDDDDIDVLIVCSVLIYIHKYYPNETTKLNLYDFIFQILHAEVLHKKQPLKCYISVESRRCSSTTLFLYHCLNLTSLHPTICLDFELCKKLQLCPSHHSSFHLAAVGRHVECLHIHLL